jgi:hypothetical protein
MDTYHVVLYIHLLSLFVGLGAASILLVCLIQLRSAQTLMDAVPWGMVAGKVTKAFPVAVVGLFATGAYMTCLARRAFRDPLRTAQRLAAAVPRTRRQEAWPLRALPDARRNPPSSVVTEQGRS